jgi:alkylated DNA repair protein (DNA oxidative demethylase)
MMEDLFAESRCNQELADGAIFLPGLVLAEAALIFEQVGIISDQAPFRHLVTPGSHVMSVAMTNCGRKGWFSDRRGYRYADTDPLSGKAWPPLPALFLDLARRAAQVAGFTDYDPDVCLINRYQPGARMSLHQDRDEGNLTAPIVSLSLGLPAIFQFGGSQRSDRPQRLKVLHGDAVVWGGPARLNFHGVSPLADGEHPMLGRQRINLTFRQI